MKKKLLSLFLVVLTLLTILPTAALAANSTGTGITPTTDSNRWTTRLTSTGASYSYRPPMAAGKFLYCMDLGYSYHYGTASFLNSYTYNSATGADIQLIDTFTNVPSKGGFVSMDHPVVNREWCRLLNCFYRGLASKQTDMEITKQLFAKLPFFSCRSIWLKAVSTMKSHSPISKAAPPFQFSSTIISWGIS